VESATNSARLRRRHAALAAVRGFFAERDFVEVDTPLLVPGPGLEPHIDPLEVHVRTSLDPRAIAEKRWLITSPELSIKRLLASTPDVTRVFQLGHVFRDGERTRRHLPEFTMLEWYRVGGTLDDLVRDHELLFAHVAQALDVAEPRAPFERATVADLFRKHAQVDVASPTLVDDVRARGDILRNGADFEDAFFHVMGAHVEPNIGHERPIVVERWPTSMAVLAKKCDDDARFAERFEVYAQLGARAGSLELSNAFAELTDPVEQRARFVEDNAKRVALGKPALPLDEDFLAVLGNLPPTAGCALGVDRLLMLLLQATDVDDVTALPWR
jgi:elongation factor P--(R)-beta-lysine ligase